MKETDVAAKVVAYLKDLCYDVHQEAGADIVAVMDNRAWAIEVKLGLGLGVLRQAYEHVQLRDAAYVSIATPVLRRSHDHIVGELFMAQHGIGWLVVCNGDAERSEWRGDYPVREKMVAKVQRPQRETRCFDLRRGLSDKTRDYCPAGSPSPRRWTPFKQVCENVRAALAAGPLTTRQIVEQIEHHYSSPAGARSRLAYYLAHGIINGVEPHEEGRPQRWQLGAPPPEAQG